MDKAAFLDSTNIVSERDGDAFTFAIFGKRKLTLPDKSDVGKIHLDVLLDSSGSMKNSVPGSSSVVFTGEQQMTLKEDTIPLTCNLNGTTINSRAITVRMGVLSALYSEMFQLYDVTFRVICYSDKVAYKSNVMDLTQENVRKISQDVISTDIRGGTQISCALEEIKNTKNKIDEDRKIVIMTLTDGYDNSLSPNPSSSGTYIESLLDSIKETHNLSMIVMGVGKPKIDFDPNFLCKYTTLESVKQMNKPLFGSNRDEMNTVCIQGYSKVISKSSSYGIVKIKQCEGSQDLETIVDEFDPSDFTSFALCKSYESKIVIQVLDESIELDLLSNNVNTIKGLSYYFNEYNNISKKLTELSEKYTYFDKLFDSAVTEKDEMNTLKSHIVEQDKSLIQYYYNLYFPTDKQEDISYSPPTTPSLEPIMLRRQRGGDLSNVFPRSLHERSCPEISEEDLSNMITSLTNKISEMENSSTSKMKSALDYGRKILVQIVTNDISLPIKPNEYCGEELHEICNIMYSMCYSQFKDYQALKYQISINQKGRSSSGYSRFRSGFAYHGSTGAVILRSSSSGLGRQVSGGTNSQSTPDHQLSEGTSNQEHKDYITCIICMENPSDTVFMNCKHSHICNTCFVDIKSSYGCGNLFCPTCRSVPKYAIPVKKAHLTNRLECPLCVEKNKQDDTLSPINEIKRDTDDQAPSLGNIPPPPKVSKMSNRAVIMFVECGHLSCCNECAKESYKGNCLTCNTKSKYINIYV